MSLKSIIGGAGGAGAGALGGVDPVSMGIQFGLGTLDKLASGENIGNAALESLPLVGGIFGNLRAKRDRKIAENEAMVTEQNTNANFGSVQSSNLPLAMGGNTNDITGGKRINPLNTSDMFTKFLSGGTHEQNPLGGIPLGKTMNSVEEGEVKFKFDDGDYVFSNRLKY